MPALPKLTETASGSKTHDELNGYPDTSNNHPGMLVFPFPLDSHNERVISGNMLTGFGVPWHDGELVL